MKKLSIIASALVLSASASFAANSVDEAFKNGKVSGDISVHHQSWDNGSQPDSGFTAGTIGLNYSTDSFNGFTLNTGFRAGHEFAEEQDGDFDGDFEQNSVMNVANISYSNDVVSLTVGRQEIDLEWLGDFNEAVVLATTAIPNTTLVAGYTTRQAAVGGDELKKFADVTKDGAYVIDAKFEGISNVMLNPYYYSAEDVANFYGLKAEYNTDTFGFTAHHATSSEKAAGQKDGSISHVEARAAISGLELSAGYITTDKDAGVASISAFGDNIDPTEELGDYVYAADTKTIYATAGYEVAGIGLSALYAVADNSATNKEDKELTVGASYGFTNSFSGELMYIDLDTESAEDKSKLVANLTYEF